MTAQLSDRAGNPSLIVTFTVFAVYRRVGKPHAANAFVELLHGATAGRFGASGQVELVADSVPYRAERLRALSPKAGEGLLALYGGDALDEVNAWQSIARDHDAEFALAEIDIGVGHLVTDRLIDRALLRALPAPAVRYLNVRRFARSLQLELLARFAAYVDAEGGDSQTTMFRPVHMANRPDLFARVLAEDPEFDRVDVLVIPVADTGDKLPRMRPVALLRPGAQVLAVRQCGDAALSLPAWMGSRRRGLQSWESSPAA